MRKTKFANGEFYHIYNRGTDKRAVFLDDTDFKRFLRCMSEFNTIEPIGSLYEHALNIHYGRRTSIHKNKLVNIICYCLNLNHYHFLFEQRVDGGISEFMKRLGGGYTKYFNSKYNRTGVLFQGKFKSRHIDSNKYLLHIGAYINLNNKAHKVDKDIFRSSMDEFLGKQKTALCVPDIILKQFKNKKEFKEFADSSLVDIIKRKGQQKEIASLLLE
ncbi:MAG: transposase [Patescibacteria group bacterium]